MLLLCAAPGLQFRIRVRHEPMFAESATLYAEDEPGNTLGRAKVEVTGIQGGKRSGHPDAVQRPLLTGMFVDPAHRRRGVAGRLLREAEEQVAAYFGQPRPLYLAHPAHLGQHDWLPHQTTYPDAGGSAEPGTAPRRSRRS